VPTINRDRSTGSSKFRLLQWISRYMYWYLYIFRYKVLNRLMKPYRENVKKT
jgi:hypothetical protein